MKDKSTDEALQIVTPQEYSLGFTGPLVSGIDPSEVWTAPSNKQSFNVKELYDLFSKECIAFVGDSTDRRAADTFHIFLTNRHNLTAISDNQNNKHFIYKWNRKYEDQTRHLFDNDNDDASQQQEGCPGSIDNIFRPKYENMLNFSYYYASAADHIRNKNYTVIVASTGPWNNLNYTPQKTREYIQKVIHHFYQQVPDDVLLLWKTASWNRYANWNHLEDNQTNNNQKHGSNYLVHYANEVTRETIADINSTRLRLVDWSKEICPYVWERKKAANMGSEDGNPWHVGAKARVLLIHMIAWEYTLYYHHHHDNEKVGATIAREEIPSSGATTNQVSPTTTLEPSCEGMECRNNNGIKVDDHDMMADLPMMTTTTNRMQYFGPNNNNNNLSRMMQQAIWIGIFGLVVLRFMARKRKR